MHQDQFAFLSQKAQNSSYFSFDKAVPQAGSALRAEGSTGSSGKGHRLTASTPLAPLPPAPTFQMLKRQQVINLDILHFFISSNFTFNEISPLTKVLLKLT